MSVTPLSIGSPAMGAPCQWCSNGGQFVWHAPCPKVRLIEYYENGHVKRVEFVGEARDAAE